MAVTSHLRAATEASGRARTQRGTTLRSLHTTCAALRTAPTARTAPLQGRSTQDTEGHALSPLCLSRGVSLVRPDYYLITI